MAHGESYAAELRWNTDFEASVARIVGDLGVPRQGSGTGAWVAEVDGQRVGSIFCVPDEQDPSTGHLHGLLVTAAGRGQGLGQDLVDRAIAFARSAGYQRLQLRTDRSLEAATDLYRRRGFLLI
jgi:GNAT superfamily N-acetyltransferase